MPRRVSLPAADELFRPTVVPDPEPDPEPKTVAEAEPRSEATPVAVEAGEKKGRTASGRVKHDEKMTVYVTADELLDIEHARLELRRHHGLAVDRGRLVRTAVALALADLDTHGADGAFVQRLREG